MSFYRTLLAVVAAAVVAMPVFAEDTTTQTTDTTATQPADTTATQTTASNEETTTATDAKVNVNTATAKELMKVKGMNASKARAIVAYRKKHGNFKSLDELSNVKGFKKQGTLDQLKDQLTAE